MGSIRFRVRQLYATAAELAAENPVLLEGEHGTEKDTGKEKIGDGVTAWLDLPYRAAGGGGAVSSVNGQTGAVVLDAEDVGADEEGAAAAAVAAHEAALDPHPGYVPEGDLRLSDARTPTAHASTHGTGGTDELTPASIGAATAAQGALADTAVQPDNFKLKFTFKEVSGAYTITAADGAAQYLRATGATTLSFSTDWFGTQAEIDAALAAAGGGDLGPVMALGGRKLTLFVETSGETVEFDAGDGFTVPAIVFASERPPAGNLWFLNVDFFAAIALLAFASEFQSSTTVDTTSEQTLANKTLGNTREATDAIADGAAVEIDMAGPGFQSWSLGATRTATLGNVAAGRQVKLSVTSNGHGLTLTGVNWGDAGAPELGSVTDVELWSDDGTTVKGAVAWRAD